MSISARPLSNSYMPTSNTPTTVKLFRRGSVPAAVSVPCGVMATTVSPRRTPRPRARSDPSTMPKPPGLSASSVARAHVRADVGDRGFLRRIDAANEHAAVRPVRRQHRLPEHVGRRGLDVRIRAAPSAPRRRRRQARALRAPRYARRPTGSGCAAPPGSRSSPTARRSAPPRRARCRPSTSAR